MSEVDLFGEYALLIAQLLTLVSIGGIFIQFARWINKHKNFARDTTFFIILVIIIIATNIPALIRIASLEKEQLALQNTTITNQETLGKILNATGTIKKNLIVDNSRYKILDPPS